MAQRYTVIPRTMSLILNQDKLLMLKAGDTKEWSGISNPVGGHVEIGEDILSSARREITEETGLDLPDTKLRGVIHVTNFYGKNILMFITLSHSQTQSVTPNHEGELEWIPLNRLNRLKTFADVIPIVKRILQLKPSQFLTGTSTFNGQDKLLSLNFS